MLKTSTYRIKKPENVCKKQDEASNSTIFILKQNGPTSFLIQDDAHRKLRVYLGEVHECSCKEFTETNDLCVHLCWILLKKFKLDPNNPISWQTGLVEREITALLSGQHSFNKNDIQRSKDIIHDSEDKIKKQNLQRKIGENDICPICQEELLCEKRYAVTFCRKSCGNNVHIRCMKVWTEHQRKQKTVGLNDFVTCPVCRGDFCPLNLLIREFTEHLQFDKKSYSKHTISQNGSSIMKQDYVLVKHLNKRCLSCLCLPICGNIYRCEICYENTDSESNNAFLCGICYRLNKHNEHEKFVYRETPHNKWMNAPLNRGTITNLSDVYLSTSVSKFIESDLCTESQSDSKSILFSDFPQPLRMNDLELIPHWTIRVPRYRQKSYIRKKSEDKISDQLEEINESGVCIGRSDTVYTTGLLSPGRQCLICLMSYNVGDEVRRLSPGCQHIFHTKCIDPWLLHRSPTCPIDKTMIRVQNNDKIQSSLEINKQTSNNLNGLFIQSNKIGAMFNSNNKPIINRPSKNLTERNNMFINDQDAYKLSIIGQHVISERTKFEPNTSYQRRNQYYEKHVEQ